MGAPLSPHSASSAEGELAELRRRAYGPEADIAADPRALARLTELERDAAERIAATAAPIPEPDSVPYPAPASAPRPVSVSSAPKAPVAPRRRSARVAWIGRHPLFVAVSATLVLAVAVAWGVVSTASTGYPDEALTPDAALGIRDGDAARSGVPDLSWIDVDTATIRRHETYEGLVAWTAKTTMGKRCLVVARNEVESDGGPSTIVGLSCLPDEFDPTVNLITGITTRDDVYDGPYGSLLRFAWRKGDDVLAWVRDAASPTPSEEAQ